MTKNIWIIGIETGLYEDEEGKKTLVQMCPKEGDDFEDCEVFTRPIEELDFWESKIGEEVDMDGVYKGWDKETNNPIWDTDLIKERLMTTEQQIERTEEEMRMKETEVSEKVGELVKIREKKDKLERKWVSSREG